MRLRRVRHILMHNSHHYNTLLFWMDALGLGACYVGFVGIAAVLNPEVRKLLGVRKKEELISTLAIGHPAVRYHRTVSRQSADLTRL